MIYFAKFIKGGCAGADATAGPASKLHINCQKKISAYLLTENGKVSILRIPCSRGVSGALYLQSAIAGVMFCVGYFAAMQPLISDVDVLVLRNGTS